MVSWAAMPGMRNYAASQSQRKRPRPEPRRITDGSVKAAPSGFPDDSLLGRIGDKCIAVSQLVRSYRAMSALILCANE